MASSSQNILCHQSYFCILLCLLQLIQRSVSIPYHRIIEWLSLKGTLKTIYFHPPAIGRIASSHQARWAFLKKMLLPMHLLRCSVLGFCAPGIQLSWCGREAAALAHEISRIGPFQVLFTLWLIIASENIFHFFQHCLTISSSSSQLITWLLGKQLHKSLWLILSCRILGCGESRPQRPGKGIQCHSLQFMDGEVFEVWKCTGFAQGQVVSQA